jgi:hypothetical protein
MAYPGLIIDENHFSIPSIKDKADIINRERVDLHKYEAKDDEYPSFGFIALGSSNHLGGVIFKCFYPPNINGEAVTNECAIVDGIKASFIILRNSELKLDGVIIYTSAPYYYRIARKCAKFMEVKHEMKRRLTNLDLPKIYHNTVNTGQIYIIDFGYKKRIFRIHFPDSSNPNPTRAQLHKILSDETRLCNTLMDYAAKQSS